MKYSIRRLINLGKYDTFFQYENVTFEVSDADSKEQAEKELSDWIAEHKKNLVASIPKRVDKKENKSNEPFTKSF